MAAVSQQSLFEGFHAVQPRRDCPHCTDEFIAPKESFEKIHVNDPCSWQSEDGKSKCGHKGENWLCLMPGCGTVMCSRYVKSHMVTHNQKKGHPICFSFADFSYWCYACDDYVVSDKLDQSKFFYSQKFGEKDTDKEVFEKMKNSKHQEQIKEEEEDEAESSDEEEKKDDLAEKMSKLNIDEKKEGFSYEELVQGLKNGKFKKICVMTGAGISVSAGIPDFRSPKTGVYANLKEYNLPNPEAIFTLDYFLENPEPFYKFATNFDMQKFNPTPTHFFIKMLQDKGILWKNFTQNIDNLEEKTGMNMDAVLQCHGANKGASCARCKAEFDKDILQEKIRNGEIYWCDRDSCQDEDYKGPIKPDIVFFGEQLPKEFTKSLAEVTTHVDLLIVMGTALAVSPFNMIPSFVKKEVPKVLFNMENTKNTGGIDFTEQASQKIFVQGKCDETLAQLVKDCGWDAQFQQTLPDYHKK